MIEFCLPLHFYRFILMDPRAIPLAIRTYALILFLKCNCSYTKFCNDWVIHGKYPGHLPKRNYMYKLVRKFQNHGLVSNIRPSGRPRSVRIQKNIEIVAEHFALNSSDSPKTFCDNYDICSQSSVRKILLLDIGWKPFKPRVCHKLNHVDFERRYWFCSTLLNRIASDPSRLSRMIFLDEIYIKLNSHMCTYNMYFYDKENPNMIIDRKSNGQGLMFLSAVSTRGSLLYCFDTDTIPEQFRKISCDDGGKKRRKNAPPYGRMPCNSATFLHLFKTKIVSDMKDLFPDISLNEIIVLLDGSSVHTERNVTQFLNDTFTEWYGNNSELPWPSHSPVILFFYSF